VAAEHLTLASATAQLTALREGEVSSEELTRAYLERIVRFNPELNAVVTVDEEGALRAARERDRQRNEEDELGPMHGLPITVKDSFEVQGMRSTAGIPGLRNYRPEVDAEAVARLRQAGAVILGKTNIPTANADFQSSNPVFGRSNNPWDLDRTPGGSAGGGGAAVAAGLSALDFGSEIGGSLRLPAHFTGIFAHKSSWRTIPLSGHLPPGPEAPRRFGIDTDLVVAGGQARSANDLEVLLSAVAGPPAIEAVAWRLRLPPPRACELADFRIALCLEDEYLLLEREVRAVLDELVMRLEGAGAKIDRDPPIPISLKESSHVYEPMLYAAFAEDRSTFSTRAAAYMLRAMARRPFGRPWRVWRWLGQSHRWWLGRNSCRLAIRDAWDRFFQDYDVVLMPVSPTVALPHHNKDHDRFGRTYVVNGQHRDYDEQPLWNAVANLSGNPSTVVPAGLSKSGLPVGLQALGPLLEDLTTIEFARRLEELTSGYQTPPGYDAPPSEPRAMALSNGSGLK
jgi:amidase